MKKARFTEEQIIGILREQEAGSATMGVCRKHGIRSATFYKWKVKYGGLDVSEARRLRSREDDNRRLKKLLAEMMLDNAMFKDVASKSGDASGEAGGCSEPVQRAWGEPAAGEPRNRGRPCLGPLPEPSTGRQGRTAALARTGGDASSLWLAAVAGPAVARVR